MSRYREFTAVPVLAGLTPGQPGHCIRNAVEAALEGRLEYAEGIALDRRLGLWFRHAWNVDAAGNAIDVTWGEDGARYIGRAHPVSRPLALAAYRGVYDYIDDPGPPVPAGGLGIDCLTARERAWITARREK
jgi:hypothetical protein